MSKLNFNILKTIVIFFLLLSTLLHAQELKDISLQLKWKYQFQFAGFIVAKEKGFYKDVGLDVELKEFDKNVNVIKDVLESKATFGIGDSNLILEAMRGEAVTGLMAINFIQVQISRLLKCQILLMILGIFLSLKKRKPFLMYLVVSSKH